MNRIFRALVPFLLLAGGVLFLVLGFHTVQQRKVFVETPAIITDIQVRYGVGDESDDYDVFVAYTVDGETYESELGEYSAGMRTGDEIEVLYNPDNPAEILSAGIFGVILQFAIGVIALLSGAVLLVKRLGGR